MNELTKKVNSDKDFDMEAYSYIKKQIDEEIAKPLRKRDLSKVERLTSELGEILDNEPVNTSESIEKLYGKIEEYEKGNTKSSKAVRKILPVFFCAAALLAANCITVFAWDMNIVSAVIEFSKGGFSVSFNNTQQEVIELPVSEDDPYGIIAECAKYDIYPETPHYIPNGFILTDMSGNVNKDFANMASFTFTNGKMSIGIDFKRYWNNDTGNSVIPSDKYNISETTVNGNPAIVSKEDNQYTITFMNDKTSFLMFTQDVPYEECEKIVNSIR